MSKEELKVKSVEQEVTKEDLKKINGGMDEYMLEWCGEIDDGEILS